MASLRPLRRLAATVVVTVAAAGSLTACGGADAPAAPPPASAGPGVPSGSSPSANQDPARFAPQVVKRAGRAKVDAQLLMAILYNESYKPHDPALERAWQRMKPDSAFGIANMHKAAFDDTKQGRDFANRSWDELPDDPDLAVEAAAWFLHDLATGLPQKTSGPYTRNELLALGYNAGAGNMSAIARGTKPGPQAQSYLDRLRANWAKAGEAVKR
ncbi:transglycosylase SLT domain-containing protein [Streptomyces sp. UNOB3_S3]|uniref:transglycosylase SLT domain-containing protein n=1 Tax=Streptomyces sp. UNOB3_S3 TaxID=2871682 RepID=UPI001E522F97|nr:transglycosylase SLT domain-containing protein [Streptomyces sp. UNOB3_S3]MCC3775827.1 transglycosylase SLT domain-containing protein [Streptomyces sp. UNOB3_S3]